MSLQALAPAAPVSYTTGAGAPSGTPTAGSMYFDVTNNLLYVGNATPVWVCITPKTAKVTASESTSSTSYTDLATSGPSVSVQTNTSALITLSVMSANNTGTQFNVAAVAVSGATTLAAADANGVFMQPAGANYWVWGTSTFVISGLTAGVNTFKVQYRVAGNTGTFGHTTASPSRMITAVAIP